MVETGVTENVVRCERCEVQEEHLNRAKISRVEYRKDVERNNCGSESFFYSMDMQKIIMLPHLPGIKTALFTRRILMIKSNDSTTVRVIQRTRKTNWILMA